MSWYSFGNDRSLVLRLYVQPGARRTEVVGICAEELKIKLAALPVDGKANRVLMEFLAERFDVPRKRITLKRGEQSRHKVVEICRPSNGPEVLFSEVKAE